MVTKDGQEIGILLGKHDLYKRLLEPKGIDFRTILSKKLLPDEAILIFKTNALFIIEKKFQSGAGSVDEKLQTCHFKKKQYCKLVDSLKIEIRYMYVFNDWFLRDEYRDVKVDLPTFTGQKVKQYLNN